MDIFECLQKRYSFRGAYKSAPVPRENLEKILKAGAAAPSACNKQTTSFIGIDDPELVKTITALVKQNGFRGGSSVAPAGVIVLTQKITAYGSVCCNVQDYAAAIENLLLAITGLGYASCWIEGQVTAAAETQQKIAQLLKIPEDYEVIAFLPVGLPEEDLKRPAYKPFEERAWFNGFGAK
jgi:nitroreductase